MTDRRVLASEDSRAIALAGSVLVALAVIAVLWPRIFAIPIAILSIWFGGAMLLQSYRLRVHGASGSTSLPKTSTDESPTASDAP